MFEELIAVFTFSSCMVDWMFNTCLMYCCCIQDKGLREIASNALSALVKYNPEYFAGVILEKLIPCTLSSDLCMRHGATLAVGEVILALHECAHLLSTGWFLSADSDFALTN